MKTYSGAIRLVICMFAILLAAGRLPAQIDRSSISGTVTDPSGAVVPGATVVVTNTATSESVTLTTASDGSYTASLLHVGPYSVEATARGFEKTREAIQLDLNQVARVDLQLKVGGAGEVTQVTSEAPLVATETSSLGTLETGNRIVDLPLNGRLFTQLAWLGPGASQG
ncbi:MAG: carboxypeptidase-like regulatory domain-containing protein, partial [Candidatus Acidiferrales bacterium]